MSICYFSMSKQARTTLITLIIVAIYSNFRRYPFFRLKVSLGLYQSGWTHTVCGKRVRMMNMVRTGLDVVKYVISPLTTMCHLSLSLGNWLVEQEEGHQGLAPFLHPPKGSTAHNGILPLQACRGMARGLVATASLQSLQITAMLNSGTHPCLS